MTFEPLWLNFLILQQEFDKILQPKKLIKKDQENLGNGDFLVYHPSNNGHMENPSNDKFSKIILKVA